MDRDEIHVLIRELPGTRQVAKNFTNWVTTHCPLAPYTHEKKSDSKPSFGIKIQPNDVSTFHCFTCKRRGSIADLYAMLYDFTGEPQYDKASKDFRHSEEFGFELPEWNVRRKRTRIILDLSGPPTPMANARDVMGTYPAVTSHAYLKHRKIGPNTAKKINLRLETGVSRKYDRIIFPVYGLDKKLYGLTGRICMKGQVPDTVVKQKDYFGFEKRKCLLGAHLLRPETRFIVLVEGPFDYARVLQAIYPNGLPLAVLHSGLTPPQLATLKKIRLPVYLFYDNDDAGKEGTEIAVKSISSHVPVLECVYPTDDIDNVFDELADSETVIPIEVASLIDGTSFSARMISDAGIAIDTLDGGQIRFTDSLSGNFEHFGSLYAARRRLADFYNEVTARNEQLPSGVLLRHRVARGLSNIHTRNPSPYKPAADRSVGTDPGSLTRPQIRYAIENAVLR